MYENPIDPVFFDLEIYAIYRAIWENWGDEAWKVVWRAGEVLFDEVHERLELYTTTPLAAMEGLNKDFADSPIASLVEMGLDSRDRDTRETIAEFGQMCSVEAGLPGAVHLIARYGDNYKAGMVENVMAGGDSSARGMMAGMVLAAANGMTAIPEAWRSGMTANQRISKLLDQV